MFIFFFVVIMLLLLLCHLYLFLCICIYLCSYGLTFCFIIILQFSSFLETDISLHNPVLFIYYIVLFIHLLVHTCVIMYIFLQFVDLIICKIFLLFIILFVCLNVDCDVTNALFYLQFMYVCFCR